MNKLNRVHAWNQEFLLGGGGGGRGQTARKWSVFLVLNLFYSLQRDPMISLQRGVSIFQEGGGKTSFGGGGGSNANFYRNPYNLWFSRGGGGGGGVWTPIPPLDPHKGSPDATVMVNQI